mgnify:CR=1 FL=1
MVNNKLMQLRKAGVHFGHKANCLNPKMIPYIFAEKNGRHILDLIQTSFLLNQACIFVKMAAQQKKNILFLPNKISNTKKSERGIKLMKLNKGQLLLEWLATRTKSELFTTSKSIRGFKKISYKYKYNYFFYEIE